MKTLIVVPSYNRPYSIQQNTLFWLEQMNVDFKIFVYESQIKYYAQVTSKENLIGCKDGIHLCGKLNVAYNYAVDNNYGLIFKVDDDMRFSRDGIKRSDKNYKKIAPQICMDFINEATKLFEDKNIGLINVAKFGSYKWEKDKGFKKRHKEIASNYYIRTELMKNIHSELIIFDDLWVSLETKLAGLDIYQYFGAYEDAATHRNKGGLQSYDRELISRKSYEYAKKIYPKIEIEQNSKHNIFDISVKKYF